MNENEEIELLELEAELSLLRPARVSPEILSNIEAGLASHTVPGVRSISGENAVACDGAVQGNVIQAFLARYGQLAAAALLVVSSTLLFLVSREDKLDTYPGVPGSSTSGTSGTSGTFDTPFTGATMVNSNNGNDRFQRVRDQSNLSNPSDGGVIVDEEGKPFRVIEYQLRERQRWSDPNDGASIEVDRPQKEQMRIPLPVF